MENTEKAGAMAKPSLARPVQGEGNKPSSGSHDKDLEAIEKYLRIQLLHDHGALFADKLQDRVDFINALADITGIKDTESTEGSVNRLFEDIAKFIHSNPQATPEDLAKQFDKNHDGKFNALDVIEAYKEGSPRSQR